MKRDSKFYQSSSGFVFISATKIIIRRKLMNEFSTLLDS